MSKKLQGLGAGQVSQPYPLSMGDKKKGGSWGKKVSSEAIKFQIKT